MSMNPAGPPATRTPPAGRPATAPPPAGAADAPPPSRLARLIARGEAVRAREDKQRGRPGEGDTGRPHDWADPDPAAAARLPAGRHPVERTLRRSKEGRTRREFARKLRICCEILTGADMGTLSADDVYAYPWHQLTVQQADDFRRDVYRRYAPQSSRNDQVSAVRRVLTQCYQAGLVSALRHDQLLETLYTLAPGPSTKRRRLAPAEIESLLAACESSAHPATGARDSAIIALFRTSGIRVSELVGLRLEDWDRSAGTILLRETKNGRTHLVLLHAGATAYLERWLAHRGSAPGALFCPSRGAAPRALHTTTVRNMLHRRAAAAGVAPFGCHDFRRTFATDLLESHDSFLVSALMNHKKVQSTAVYDLRGDRERLAAVETLALPALPTQAAPAAGGRAA